MKKRILVFSLLAVSTACHFAFAEDSRTNDIVPEGLNFKDMKITTDDTFKYIELKHSDGLKTYKVSEFPMFNVGMKDGTVVEKAKLMEINPAGITVAVPKGAKNLKFSDMNEACQSFFSYDSKAADAYLSRTGKKKAEKQMKDQEAASADKPSPPPAQSGLAASIPPKAEDLDGQIIANKQASKSPPPVPAHLAQVCTPQELEDIKARTRLKEAGLRRYISTSLHIPDSELKEDALGSVKKVIQQIQIGPVAPPGVIKKDRKGSL